MYKACYFNVIKIKEIRTLGGDVSEVNELLRQGWRLFPDGVMPTHDRHGRPSVLYVLFLTKDAEQNAGEWL